MLISFLIRKFYHSQAYPSIVSRFKIPPEVSQREKFLKFELKINNYRALGAKDYKDLNFSL